MGFKKLTILTVALLSLLCLTIPQQGFGNTVYSKDTVYGVFKNMDFSKIVNAYNYKEGFLRAVVDYENAMVTFYAGDAPFLRIGMTPDAKKTGNALKEQGLWDAYYEWVQGNENYQNLDQNGDEVISEDEAENLGAMAEYLSSTTDKGGLGWTNDKVTKLFAQNSSTRETHFTYDNRTGALQMTITYLPTEDQKGRLGGDANTGYWDPAKGIANGMRADISFRDASGREISRVQWAKDSVGLPFKQIDADKSTGISKEEWTQYSGKTNAFESVDSDGNGSIDANELKAFYQKQENVQGGDPWQLQSAAFFDLNNDGINDEARGHADVLGANIASDLAGIARPELVVVKLNPAGQITEVFAGFVDKDKNGKPDENLDPNAVVNPSDIGVNWDQGLIARAFYDVRGNRTRVEGYGAYTNPTEDKNGNGTLDPGEDLNGNGTIDTNVQEFNKLLGYMEMTYDGNDRLATRKLYKIAETPEEKTKAGANGFVLDRSETYTQTVADHNRLVSTANNYVDRNGDKVTETSWYLFNNPLFNTKNIVPKVQ